MKRTTLNSLKDLPAAEWDALLAQDNPFVCHGFLSALEDSASVGGRTGWQVAHQLWHDRQGQLVAALPAYLKSHSFGEYVFDMSWAQACERAGIGYYPKLLCAVPFSPVTGPRLFGDGKQMQALLTDLEQALVEQGLSGLHVNFVDEQADELLRVRQGWLARLDCQFHWHNRGYRDFQDFLETLSSRKRKQMRKEREQVAGLRLEFDWQSGAQISQLEWDQLYQCYVNTYRVRGRMPYLTREFFSLLAQRLPDALRVLVVRRGGQIVAMALYLERGGQLYGRYWGCLDELAFVHFEACIYQGIERAIAQGLQRFDAGAQGEHKLLRGFEPQLTRSWHYLCHSGLRSAVAEFLAQERPAVQRYVEQARGHLPYKQNGA